MEEKNKRPKVSDVMLAIIIVHLLVGVVLIF